MLDAVTRTDASALLAANGRHDRAATTARDADDTDAARLDRAALAEILEELDTGVIACSETGRLAFANNVARRELRSGRPLALDDTGLLQLAEDAQAALRQWQAALRSAALLRHRQMLALGCGSQRLMVSVMPLGSQPRYALVMLGRRQPAPDLAVEMLGSLYALTSAEQQVLVGLLAGLRVENIACERGVTVSTLRSQVGSLREKLGAGRLEDLVRLAAGLPPMSSVLRSPPLWIEALTPDGRQARAA